MTVTVSRNAAMAAVAGLLVAAGCTASTGPVGPPPSLSTGSIAITADDLAFDRVELLIAADRPFALLFENRESAPHNVSLLAVDSGQALFVGEIFGGPGWRLYEIPAIPAGIHSFRCDVHPEMTGSVVAEATWRDQPLAWFRRSRREPERGSHGP